MRKARSARLFAPEELKLRPTGQARFLAMAARPPRPASEREERAEEDSATLARLRDWGVDLQKRFKLKAWILEAEQEGVTEHYGICYEDGLIRIRLRHAKTGKLLKESSLVDTLCHELAHLRHLNHGLGFRRLYQRILDAARELGYYKPGRDESRRPRQGTLFDGACGTARSAARRK
jgi:hypothetical protein